MADAYLHPVDKDWRSNFYSLHVWLQALALVAMHCGVEMHFGAPIGDDANGLVILQARLAQHPAVAALPRYVQISELNLPSALFASTVSAGTYTQLAPQGHLCDATILLASVD